VILFEITGNLCSKCIVVNIFTHVVSIPYYLLQSVFKYLIWYTKGTVFLLPLIGHFLHWRCVFLEVRSGILTVVYLMWVSKMQINEIMLQRYALRIQNFKIQSPTKKCIHSLTDGICVLFSKLN
jgi:hypothetical protein